MTHPSKRKGSTPEQMHAWYLANKDHKRAYNARYRRDNRVRLALLSANKRAREVGAKGEASIAQIQARIDFYGGLCWICRTKPWEQLDHVIPWVRGGANWPANIRPACAACNNIKSSRDPRRLHGPTRRGNVLVAA